MAFMQEISTPKRAPTMVIVTTNALASKVARPSSDTGVTPQTLIKMATKIARCLALNVGLISLIVIDIKSIDPCLKLACSPDILIL